MLIKRGQCETDHCLRLRDLKPGDVFERVCECPQALYLVLQWERAEGFTEARERTRREKWRSSRGIPARDSRAQRERWIEKQEDEGRYPVADLTNNRYLVGGYFDPDTPVRLKRAEVRVKPESAF